MSLENLYKRQTAIFDPSKFATQRVYIIGAGNIGSHSALAIARMGLRSFVLCDFDTIEEHNLASQAYTFADIGALKVATLGNAMRAVNPGALVVEYPQSYQKAHANGAGIQAGDIVIVAVDSLDTRREIAGLIKDIDCFVIDGRMGGGQVEVHTAHARDYGAIIPTQGDTDECSARYISYTALLIAGAIANTAKRYLQKERLAQSFVLHADTWEVLSTFTA